MVMMVVILVVPMMVAIAAIGAPHGRERFGDLAYRGPQSFEHVPDDVVATDQQAACSGLDLAGKMAVADMPDQFGKMLAVARPNLMKIFLAGNHLNHAPIVKHQHITAFKGN
jgi:hypothetical protein